MKKYIFLALVIAFCGCVNESKKEVVENKVFEDEVIIDLKDKKFDDIFIKIGANEFDANVFLLFENTAVLTSGTKNDYNSMTIGFGGFGQYFDGPTSWCFLRANRYTLEYIRNVKTYTITFFDEKYKEQVSHFGKTSGRDTDKMGTHEFHSVYTPMNNITYKEAKTIVECELLEITTVSPDDFYFDDEKRFVENAFDEVNDYHKIVFGKIKNIWVKK